MTKKFIQIVAAILGICCLSACHPHKDNDSSDPCASQPRPNAGYTAYVKVGSKYYPLSDTLWLEKGGNKNPAKGPSDNYLMDTTLPMSINVYLMDKDSTEGATYNWHQISPSVTSYQSAASLFLPQATPGAYTFTLRATKIQGRACIKSDSVTKTLIVAFNENRVSPLQGYYRGVNTDAPLDTFTVAIKMSDQDSLQTSGYKLSIYNLPNHYTRWTALGSSKGVTWSFQIYNTAFCNENDFTYRSVCDTTQFCIGEPINFTGEFDSNTRTLTIDYSYQTGCTANYQRPICQGQSFFRNKRFVGIKIM